MSDSTYNGWKNYETWVTALWLGNDQGTDEAAREIVAMARQDAPDYPNVAAADALKDWVEEAFIDPVTEADDTTASGLVVDLLRSAFGSVNWLEVAAAFTEEDSAPSVCRHCTRTIVERNGRWIDPEATGDDSVWRETCDEHDTFTAEHEPTS